jgi:hypothetical protein
VAALETTGEHFYQQRAKLMDERKWGFTEYYNRLHDPDETCIDIQERRAVHVEMDKAVAAAYGWSDLVLDHDFHETKQGTRFTISEAVRREVLQRLLKLNHKRHEAETRRGPMAKTKGSRGHKKQKTDPGDLPLLGTEGA